MRNAGRSLVLGFAAMCYAQVSKPPTIVYTKAPTYIELGAMPAAWHDPLVALGDRIQKPGGERLTITGTYRDANGAQPLRITWEAPSKLRVDFTGVNARTLIFDGKSASSSAGMPTSGDDDVFETLATDRPEAALFGIYQQQMAWRFFGNRFRTDDGLSKQYSGPLYDIYQLTMLIPQRSDKAQRRKLFFFDSTTKLFLKSQYLTQHGNSTVNVEIAYLGWSTPIAAEMPLTPTQIVRRENGVDTITFIIASAQVLPAVNDGLFTQP